MKGNEGAFICKILVLRSDKNTTKKSDFLVYYYLRIVFFPIYSDDETGDFCNPNSPNSSFSEIRFVNE